MVQIANISQSRHIFRQKDGTDVDIGPGEAASVDIDRDDFTLSCKVGAGQIVVGGTEKAAAKVARERSPVSPPNLEPAAGE